MTRDDFDNLRDGDRVWFAPSYFAFPMLAVVKTVDWVNFFGEGQCLFAPLTEAFYCSVSPCRGGRR